MSSCFQMQGMSIYDHGLDVRRWYVELRDFLLTGEPLRENWRLPEWIHHESILSHLESIDDSLVEMYQVYHDCGKPVCMTIDGDGKRHFPDHAAVSKREWLRHNAADSRSLEIAELIGMDMDVHLLRPAGVEEFRNRPQALTLLLTGLCELHSNARMFGGIDSPGFKSKFKNIDRLGSRIVGAK